MVEFNDNEAENHGYIALLVDKKHQLHLFGNSSFDLGLGPTDLRAKVEANINKDDWIGIIIVSGWIGIRDDIPDTGYLPPPE